MTNEDLERMIIRKLQNNLPSSSETKSLTLTQTTLEHITAGTLHDHINTFANDAVTTLKDELELAANTDTPSSINDKSRSILLKQHKKNS